MTAKELTLLLRTLPPETPMYRFGGEHPGDWRKITKLKHSETDNLEQPEGGLIV